MHFLHAQIAYPIPSSSSLASTAAADFKNRTPFQNPASWSHCQQAHLVSSLESNYAIPELATKTMMLMYPFKQFVGSFSFAHHGFALYHEMIFASAFTRNFSDKFSMGLQFNYHNIYLASSERYAGTLYPQVGFIIPFTKQFALGVHLNNPFAANIKTEYLTKYIPAIYSIGCSHHFSQDFSWRMQVDKELHSQYRVATALDYSMSKYNRVQLGLYVQEVVVPCLGFGIDFKHFSFDLAVEIHPLLGLNNIAQIQLRL